MLPLITLVSAIMGGPQIQEEPIFEKSYIVLYNIQDLEINISNYPNAPEIDLSNALNSQQGNIFKNSGTNQSFANQKDFQIIIQLIKETIEPEIWDDSSIASVRYWKGNLIILAPKKIHDKIK